MEIKNRKSAFELLKNYCPMSSKDSYMELTEWANGEGFDVAVFNNETQRFSMTYGEFNLLNILVNIDKEDTIICKIQKTYELME